MNLGKLEINENATSLPVIPYEEVHLRNYHISHKHLFDFDKYYLREWEGGSCVLNPNKGFKFFMFFAPYIVI